MGYTTQFKGELKFAKELTASQLAKVSSMLGEDCRNHKDWGAAGLYHMDLELLPDFSGIKWDGSEKTYEMDKLVNVVIREMRKTWPDFGLTGAFAAQGEEVDDRWQLVFGDDGFAKRVKVKIVGTKVECPSCEHKFYIE